MFAFKFQFFHLPASTEPKRYAENTTLVQINQRCTEKKRKREKGWNRIELAIQKWAGRDLNMVHIGEVSRTTPFFYGGFE
jgi:hypothetical protein